MPIAIGLIKKKSSILICHIFFASNEAQCGRFHQSEEIATFSLKAITDVCEVDLKCESKSFLQLEKGKGNFYQSQEITTHKKLTEHSALEHPRSVFVSYVLQMQILATYSVVVQFDNS